MALDTNVVLRFILGDHPQQADAASAIIRQPCFIPLTVLVEAGWVLANSYALPRQAIANALLALLDQPTVALESENEVRWALRRYRDHGADLADMVHLVASVRRRAFVTFDRRLAGQAGDDSPVPVDTLS